MAEPVERKESESETARIAKAFCDCTLPYEEWSHEAHLRVGLWHLLAYSPAESATRMRDGIRVYNHACGVPNTDHSGYHETVTFFYMAMIAHFLDGENRSKPVDCLAEKLVARYGEKRLPLYYYSKEVLRSKAARLGWVEPDLQPLPKPFLGQ